MAHANLRLQFGIACKYAVSTRESGDMDGRERHQYLARSRILGSALWTDNRPKVGDGRENLFCEGERSGILVRFELWQLPLLFFLFESLKGTVGVLADKLSHLTVQFL